MLSFKQSTLLFFLFYSLIAHSQTSLSGTVCEKDLASTIPFADVILYKNDVLITGTQTDFDGNYLFGNIDPGVYSIEARYIGLVTQRVNHFVVKPGLNNTFYFSLEERGIIISCGYGPINYVVPLIDFHMTTSGKIISSEQIKTMAVGKN